MHTLAWLTRPNFPFEGREIGSNSPGGWTYTAGPKMHTYEPLQDLHMPTTVCITTWQAFNILQKAVFYEFITFRTNHRQGHTLSTIPSSTYAHTIFYNLHHLFHFLSQWIGLLGSTCPWHTLCYCCLMTTGTLGHHQSHLCPFSGQQRAPLPPTPWWWPLDGKVWYRFPNLVSKWQRQSKHWGSSHQGRILPRERDIEHSQLCKVKWEYIAPSPIA